MSKDMEKVLKDVKFFNGKLYYKISSVEESNKLLNRNGNFKNFIVVDVTAGTIFNEQNICDYLDNNDKIEVLKSALNHIRYKIYKEIKVK